MGLMGSMGSMSATDSDWWDGPAWHDVSFDYDYDYEATSTRALAEIVFS